ncbi:hypothetical protein GW17_00038037 [Ensete ventricosum]|nr:hypothetical protein GW17_00038037 [Ensete ventricosum]
MDEQDVDLIVAVDADGCFTKEITDFCGRYVKDADKDIINAVKARLTGDSLLLSKKLNRSCSKVTNKHIGFRNMSRFGYFSFPCI